MLRSTCVFKRISVEVRVKRLVIATVRSDKIKQLVLARANYSVRVLNGCEYVLVHIRVKNSISRAFVKRAEKLHTAAVSQIAIGKSVV